MKHKKLFTLILTGLLLLTASAALISCNRTQATRVKANISFGYRVVPTEEEYNANKGTDGKPLPIHLFTEEEYHTYDQFDPNKTMVTTRQYFVLCKIALTPEETNTVEQATVKISVDNAYEVYHSTLLQGTTSQPTEITKSGETGSCKEYTALISLPKNAGETKDDIFFLFQIKPTAIKIISDGKDDGKSDFTMRADISGTNMIVDGVSQMTFGMSSKPGQIDALDVKLDGHTDLDSAVLGIAYDTFSFKPVKYADTYKIYIGTSIPYLTISKTEVRRQGNNGQTVTKTVYVYSYSEEYKAKKKPKGWYPDGTEIDDDEEEATKFSFSLFPDTNHYRFTAVSSAGASIYINSSVEADLSGSWSYEQQSLDYTVSDRKLYINSVDDDNGVTEYVLQEDLPLKEEELYKFTKAIENGEIVWILSYTEYGALQLNIPENERTVTYRNTDQLRAPVMNDGNTHVYILTAVGDWHHNNQTVNFDVSSEGVLTKRDGI